MIRGRFAIAELLARIRATLRNKPVRRDDTEGDKITVKNLTVYPARFEARVGDESVELTKKEYALLEFLMKNKRAVLSREQILQQVWGYDYVGDTNIVDVYIRYLRAKIDDRFGEKYIHTVRGIGYVIKE